MAAAVDSIAGKRKENLLEVSRQENFSEWYRAVLDKAGLAENSAVRGCMVIKPWGFGLWEQIQRQLDDQFKQERCCQNAYFPLFIPVGFFAKEAEHVAGFAKECAVVTHSRMKLNEKNQMVPDPDSALAEPLIVRPTSETIIGQSMRDWIQSHRDLPIKLNQWCNVVRWEHRTSPFLRTTEFLWQEGHCAFASEEEAMENARKMGQLYCSFMTQVCGLGVILGEKSPSEKFAGADRTFCLEAMMQDGKAVQAGTSHYLGTHFSKASEIKFTDADGENKYCYTTSWGLSTRLVGAMIMTHSDDDGLRIPPRLAPDHVVIIPSGYKNLEKRNVYIEKIERMFDAQKFFNRAISIFVDRKDTQVGLKKYEWVRKGVPIRLEVGAREADQGTVVAYRRDFPYTQSTVIKIDELVSYVLSSLEEIQGNYLNQAQVFLHTHIRSDITTLQGLQKYYEDTTSIGFVRAKWVGPEDAEARVEEEKLKSSHKVSIRCIPLEQSNTEGTCILTGKPATLDVILGKSY